jgi:hypothetical protein
LRNLVLLSSKDRLSIVESRLTWNGRTPEENYLPILYSGKFMVTVRKALDKGDISERRAASLLDLSIDALWNVMASYHLSDAEEGPDTDHDPAR